jgi:NAD(P)-dependent dehydrogenase (short-subunit alcohol dehydrogenase family)
MNGRVALVTGGGRGIGREAALLLSAEGARVMVVSRSDHRGSWWHVVGGRMHESAMIAAVAHLERTHIPTQR